MFCYDDDDDDSGQLPLSKVRYTVQLEMVVKEMPVKCCRVDIDFCLNVKSIYLSTGQYCKCKQYCSLTE